MSAEGSAGTAEELLNQLKGLPLKAAGQRASSSSNDSNWGTSSVNCNPGDDTDAVAASPELLPGASSLGSSEGRSLPELIKLSGLAHSLPPEVLLPLVGDQVHAMSGCDEQPRRLYERSAQCNLPRAFDTNQRSEETCYSKGHKPSVFSAQLRSTGTYLAPTQGSGSSALPYSAYGLLETSPFSQIHSGVCPNGFIQNNMFLLGSPVYQLQLHVIQLQQQLQQLQHLEQICHVQRYQELLQKWQQLQEYSSSSMQGMCGLSLPMQGSSRTTLHLQQLDQLLQLQDLYRLQQIHAPLTYAPYAQNCNQSESSPPLGEARSSLNAFPAVESSNDYDKVVHYVANPSCMRHVKGSDETINCLGHQGASRLANDHLNARSIQTREDLLQETQQLLQKKSSQAPHTSTDPLEPPRQTRKPSVLASVNSGHAVQPPLPSKRPLFSTNGKKTRRIFANNETIGEHNTYEEATPRKGEFVPAKSKKTKDLAVVNQQTTPSRFSNTAESPILSGRGESYNETCISPAGRRSNPHSICIPGRPGSEYLEIFPVKINDRFQCSQCDKTFKHAKHVRRHGLTHSNLRLHTCKYCNTKFNRNDTLVRHTAKCVIRYERKRRLMQKEGAGLTGATGTPVNDVAPHHRTSRQRERSKGHHMAFEAINCNAKRSRVPFLPEVGEDCSDSNYTSSCGSSFATSSGTSSGTSDSDSDSAGEDDVVLRPEGENSTERSTSGNSTHAFVVPSAPKRQASSTEVDRGRILTGDFPLPPPSFYQGPTAPPHLRELAPIEGNRKTNCKRHF